MRGNRQTLAFVAAGVAVALTVAGAAVAALGGHAATAATTVKVTEREYHIALSTATPPAGRIAFRIHNAGHVTHQFDVSGGGLKAVARAGSIKPGATKTLTLTLSGGTVRVWCPVPGHAALGMKATLKVKGSTGTATGGSGGTSTSPTTTSGYVWG
jgi:plastocyanin